MAPYRNWPFLSVAHHPVLSALWALLAHGIIGVLVISPILWRSRRPSLYGLFAFVGASAIDFDHVVAAASVNFHKLETMNGRPDGHSLLTALMLALLGWALTRRKIAAWCVFAVTASHLLFDAVGGGTPLLFPLTRPDAVPWLTLPSGLVVLLGASAVVAAQPRGGGSFPVRSISIEHGQPFRD